MRRPRREFDQTMQPAREHLQTASWLALRPLLAIGVRGALVSGLADPRPSNFSMEMGNERTRVPVA